MSARDVARLAVCGAVVLLAGCVATHSNGRPIDQKEAARANMQLGVAYLRQGNISQAKDKLEKAEKQDPRSYEVQYALALYSERINQPADAERHYQSALKLSSNNGEVSNAYAVFLCRSNKVDPALRLFEEVVKNPLYNTPWVAATNAAVCLRSDKRNADAVPWLERALAQRPDYYPAVVELGDLHIANSEPQKARVAVDRFLSIGRKSPDVLLVGVRAALAQGDRPAADVYARLMRRDFPNAPATQALPQLLQAPAAPKQP
ncbi:MAG TPA: type IV pilus biogenesis/stability protein PilW [Steroidobacteraceae bacterium]|nr:type IV pilus biogenesis/stability protein PilW [Steroidobacteraceae bacterium]